MKKTKPRKKRVSAKSRLEAANLLSNMAFGKSADFINKYAAKPDDVLKELLTQLAPKTKLNAMLRPNPTMYEMVKSIGFNVWALRSALVDLSDFRQPVLKTAAVAQSVKTGRWPTKPNKSNKQDFHKKTWKDRDGNVEELRHINTEHLENIRIYFKKYNRASLSDIEAELASRKRL